MKKTTFIILCLEGAILSFNVAACSALIPSISKELATPAFITARIIWLYMLPYGIAALFYGPLVRVFDAKNVELICMALFSLANLLAGLAKNIQTLFAARFAMGVFGASVIPLALILIAREINSLHRGRFVGLFFSTTFIASLLGLFLSGIIPWRMIFFIPAISGLIICIFIYFYLPSFKPDEISLKISAFTSMGYGGSAEARKSVGGNYLAAFKNKTIISLFTYIFLISMFYHAIQQWLGVYFSVQYKFSQFLISMLVTSTSLSGIFGEAIGGWLSDTFGRLKTVNLGIILMLIGVFALLFRLPLLILIMLMIIWGAGWTFNHAGISTILTDLPKEFLNEAASLNSSVRFISGGLGVVSSGLLMQKSFNLGFAFFGTCLLCLLFLTRWVLIKSITQGRSYEW